MSRPDGDAPRDPGSGEPAASPPPTPDDATRWAGRAAVPPPRLEEEAHGWVEHPPSRLFPAFVTAVVVLLVGVLGVGAVLLLRDEPPVAAPPTEPVRTSVPVVTVQPTTRPVPTSAEPTALVVPVLLGQDYDSAAAALTALGLVPQREDVFHEWPVGVVTGTDPGEDTAVSPGATVTVFVSKGPQPSTSPSARPPRPEPTVTGTHPPR